MTNAEILDAIKKLQFLVSQRDGEESDEIVISANAQIKVLMAKLDFEEKAVKKQPNPFAFEELMARQQFFQSGIGNCMQGTTIDRGVKRTYEELEKEYNDLCAKIQNGEYVMKPYYEAEQKRAKKAESFIWKIKFSWYFKWFGNIEKIYREIALDEAINEKM